MKVNAVGTRRPLRQSPGFKLQGAAGHGRAGGVASGPSPALPMFTGLVDLVMCSSYGKSDYTTLVTLKAHRECSTPAAPVVARNRLTHILTGIIDKETP